MWENLSLRTRKVSVACISRGIFIENIWAFSWDKKNCPLYMGAHIKWISVEWGSTVQGNTRKKDSLFVLGMEELIKEKLSLEEELNALKSDSVSTQFVLVSWAKLCELAISKLPSAPGGGGSPPSCEPYGNVPPLKVWFLCRFGLESVGFWGATGVYGSICYFNYKWIEKERVLSDFNMDFKKWFCWPYILINDDTISAYARSENGCGKRPLLVWNRAGQDLEGRVLKQG